MNDRFLFNAIVSSYYDIDTPDNYEEFEPTFYLKNVDVFSDEIGIAYDDLLKTIKEQSKDLTEKEIGQIMQHFEDNSNAYDSDYVTIRPDKILQCTGLKDKNGTLIYEGDVVKNNRLSNVYSVFWHNDGVCFLFKNLKVKNTISMYVLLQDYKDDLEVIGNIYENPELIKE